MISATWNAPREAFDNPNGVLYGGKGTADLFLHIKPPFPGPNGAPLSRAALHNALRRLNLTGERNGTRHITPEKIRGAFSGGASPSEGDPALAQTSERSAPLYFAFEPTESELACSLKERIQFRYPRAFL